MSEPKFNSNFQGEKQLNQQAESIINYISETKSDPEITQRDLITGSPYKGLEKFRVEDKDKFFGREDWITRLTEHLQTKSVLLLLGASGSGKSSLIQAGVIPQLTDEIGSTNLVNLTFVPDVNPFESLYGCLISPYGLSNAKKAQTTAEDTLIKVVDELKEADKTWLIFIDQFEELFTRTPKQTRDIFIKALNKLIKRQDTKVKIILTMRADFLDKFSAYSALGEIHNQYSLMLTEIEETGVRLAIAEPAARNGVIFENGLVEQIISDFQFKDEDRSGKLPLLQYTLDLLWQKSSLKEEKGENNRTLTSQTYNNIGKVKGALNQHIREIYKKFTTDEQKIVEQILLELIALEGKEAVSRRVTKQNLEKDEKQSEVLKKLIDNRLLVSQDKGKNATVEVAHEELLRSWDVITNLIAEKRELINLRNRLTTDAEQWHQIRQESQQKAKSELWGGTKLSRIIEFQDGGLLPNLDTIARDFIKASLQEEKRKQNAKIRTACTITGISLAGLLGTGWFALRERQQAQIAIKARVKAEDQTQIANQKTKEAELNLANYLAINVVALSDSNHKDLDTLLMAIRAGKLSKKYKVIDPRVMLALALTLETNNSSSISLGEDHLLQVDLNQEKAILALNGIALNGKKNPIWFTTLPNVSNFFNQEGKISSSQSSNNTITFIIRDNEWILDAMLEEGCKRLRPYLTSNPNVSEKDRKLCE